VDLKPRVNIVATVINKVQLQISQEQLIWKLFFHFFIIITNPGEIEVVDINEKNVT